MGEMHARIQISLGQGVKLQTRVDPTKFLHFKTHTLGNRGGLDPGPHLDPRMNFFSNAQ